VNAAAAVGGDPADLLHPAVRRWVAEKGWSGLRPMQARAIEAVLRSDADVIVSAGTASGKTEAAFLPAVSSLAASPVATVGILSVSPLRSLINDQHGRLESLGEAVGLPVTRWHGETRPEDKERLRRNPAGIVIITPESLEALLLRRRGSVERMFGHLRHVVVDELHAFLAGDRGAQLASLLVRLDVAVGRRIRRIGLSATLGDPRAAAAWLRPSDPGKVVVVAEQGTKPIEARLEAVLEQRRPDWIEDIEAEELGYRTGTAQLADRLAPRLAEGKNLIFAGSRRSVETLADALRRRAESSGFDNAFHPHHGSLSKVYRQQVEDALRRPGTPATAVATTTLELGIDIGPVERVVNVGPPRSLAALRQRAGRSGRREGTVPTLDLAVVLRPPAADCGPLEDIQPDLVCAAAAIHLLHAGYVEPPADSPASLSVLCHQILCIAAALAPVDADRLAAILGRAAPFRRYGAARIRDLLVRLSASQCGFLERLGGGLVRPGPEGRRILEGPDVFSVFATPVELGLVYEGTRLGSIPVAGGSPLGPGDSVVFQGRRWTVERIEFAERTAFVAPAPRGSAIKFEGGESAPMHDALPRAMREVYASDAYPPWLDHAARNVLHHGRRAYRSRRVDAAPLQPEGAGTVALPFVGTLRLKALALGLQGEGLQASASAYAVHVEGATPAMVREVLGLVAREAPARLAGWLSTRGTVPEGKFDGLLDPAFRASWWAETNEVGRLAAETASFLLGFGRRLT
jgi:ATP-dependent helicase Lhr and Lhr-like helicase